MSMFILSFGERHEGQRILSLHTTMDKAVEAAEAWERDYTLPLTRTTNMPLHGYQAMWLDDGGPDEYCDYICIKEYQVQS